MTNDTFKTPGQLIAHLLEERDWTQRTLATVLEVTEHQVSKLINGRKAVNAELALRLEEAFGISAERFLDLQKSHDLEKARIERVPDDGRRRRARLLSDFPIKEAIDRGWLNLQDVSDLEAVEREVARFFRVDSPDEITAPVHAARKTHVKEEITGAQLFWLQRVREVAEHLLVGRYTEFGARRALKKLDGLLGAAGEARQVPAILAEAGIRYVVVEAMKAAKIDGVCFWLDEDSPVIGMTLRYDRIDNFWFVLRHELEHVIRGHGRDAPALDVELEGKSASTDQDIPVEERVANMAAAEFCVPQDKLQMFIKRKDPFFSERDVVAFARMIDVHPGLIVGQIQRHSGRYNLLRKHLAAVRATITRNAAVDGWGDVFPVGGHA